MSSTTTSHYGLLVRNVETHVLEFQPLPLHSVHVSVQAFDFCSEVTVTQTYRNYSRTRMLDSEYVFPLDENSAVCGFRAEMNGRLLTGVVKEKEEAKQNFKIAKAQGKSTMLLEQKQENIFQISIGNFAPASECRITLTYITTLDLEGKSNRLTIPAVVYPRYSPESYFQFVVVGAGINSTGTIVNESDVYDDAWFGKQSTISIGNVHTEAQSFSMQIELLMPSEIVSIISETHQDRINVTLDPVAVVVAAGVDPNGKLAIPHHARVEFSGFDKNGLPQNLDGKDFNLKITQKVYLEARAVLEVDPSTGSQAVQLAFCPETIDIMDASSLQVEIIFLIDQSGSMYGSPIESVKQCLEIFLKSLPVACRFNLVSFGTDWKKCFTHSEPYSEKSIATALEYVQKIRADLGGTEIFHPLKYCFESKGDVSYPRQIFLLTDGQVSNVQELIDLTKKHSQQARLFTFGLGTGVDRHLVKSLASVGNGECEFVSGIQTDEAKQELNGKIMRNLVRSLQPSLMDVKIDWKDMNEDGKSGYRNIEETTFASPGVGFFSKMFGGNGKDGGSNSNGSNSTSPKLVLQSPAIIAPIFPPHRRIIYGLDAKADLPKAGEEEKIVNLQVTAHSNRIVNGDKIQGKVNWSIPINLSRPQQGSFLHKLAARARIGELQNQGLELKGTIRTVAQKQKDEIIALGLKYQLLSNYTSFIIVDEASDKKNVVTEMIQHKRVVQEEPVSISTMSSSSGGSAPGGARGGGPMRSTGPPQQQSFSSSSSSSIPVPSFGAPSPGPSMSMQRSGVALPGSRPGPRTTNGAPAPVISVPASSISSGAAPAPAPQCPPSMPLPSFAMRREAPAPAPSVQSASFTKLVSIAGITGTWELTDDFITLIQQIAESTGQSSDVVACVKGFSVASLTALATTLSLQPKSISTLLALWAFTSCYKDRSSEWMMLAGKAKGALRSSLGVPVEKIEEVTKKIVTTA